MNLIERIEPYAKSIILGFSARKCLNELDSFVGISDKNFNLLCANEPFRRAFNIKKLPNNLSNFIPQKEMEQVRSVIGSLEPKNPTIDYQLEIDNRIAGFRGKAIYNKRGKLDHYIIIGQDITKKVEHEEKLKDEAFKDPLTDLYNRRYFNEQLKIFGQSGNIIGLTAIALDLDDLKTINNKDGHNIGDQKLKEVGIAIKKTIKAADVAARTGGDEFIILLPNIVNSQTIQNVLNRLQTSFIEHNIQVSFGFATKIKNELYGNPNIFNETIKEADQKLLEAKSKYKGTF